MLIAASQLLLSVCVAVHAGQTMRNSLLMIDMGVHVSADGVLQSQWRLKAASCTVG